MAYTLTIGIALGASKAGLTLNGQLVDTAGVDVGSAIGTGFVEVGGGNYLLTASVPDGHRGGLKVYETGVPATILAACAVNPEEAEYVDASVASRLAAAAYTPGGDASAANQALILGAVDAIASDYQQRGVPVTLPDPAPVGYGGGGGGVTLLELQGELAALAGAGWTTETLKAIFDAIAALPAPGDATLLNQTAILSAIGSLPTPGDATAVNQTAILQALSDIKGAGWTTQTLVALYTAIGTRLAAAGYTTPDNAGIAAAQAAAEAAHTDAHAIAQDYQQRAIAVTLPATTATLAKQDDILTAVAALSGMTVDPSNPPTVEEIVAAIDSGSFDLDAILSLLLAIKAKTDTIISPFTLGTVNDPAPTTTSFITTGLAVANVGQEIVFVSGVLNGRRGKVIENYDAGTAEVTLQAAFTEAPANGDSFIAIG